VTADSRFHQHLRRKEQRLSGFKNDRADFLWGKYRNQASVLNPKKKENPPDCFESAQSLFLYFIDAG
jgi:hypothetical protein